VLGIKSGELQMISLCDGCQTAFTKSLNTMNAKEWKSNLCNTPLKISYECDKADCNFSVEGECCVEFQFCDSCLNNHLIVDKLFASYAAQRENRHIGHLIA
jgi:hypothetical protein